MESRKYLQVYTVQWVNSKTDFKKVIYNVLNGKVNIEQTRKWFDIINQPPQNKASERMINTIEKLMI